MEEGLNLQQNVCFVIHSLKLIASSNLNGMCLKIIHSMEKGNREK